MGGRRFKTSPEFARTADGRIFASQRECARYCVLKLLQKAGEISNLELQPAFKVQIGGKHYCTYTADFAYNDKDGRRIVEDVKSTGTAKDTAYRLRKKAAELYYGFKVEEVI